MRLTALTFLLLATPAFAQAPATPPADPVVAPIAVEPVPPALANPPMTGPRLLISTAMGDISVQLDSAHAPVSVANILKFVKAKHYDGTVVYRVAAGFVIQMGSWEAHMKGRGYKPVSVPLEANNGLHNLRGTLARAEAPDSAGPEFFISLADNTSQLDHAPGDPGNNTGYAVFGQVTGGMDVVDAIGKVAVGDDGPIPGQAPVEPILIKKISLLK
jgi:cyclophilin family peptidyl-prolyl cis-trans isomerase